jgi:hypothetical protein
MAACRRLRSHGAVVPSCNDGPIAVRPEFEFTTKDRSQNNASERVYRSHVVRRLEI